MLRADVDRYVPEKCQSTTNPCPATILSDAADAHRERQLPFDMAVSNYTWKCKNNGVPAMRGPLPTHIGQSNLAIEAKIATRNPKSPHSPESQAAGI